MSNDALRVDLRRLEDFQPVELYRMLCLRVAVFVVEQACAYPELDGLDEQCWHLRLLVGDELAASARIVPPDGDQPPSIGRVVVAPAYRSRKLGKTLMREAIAACEKLYPGQPIKVGAQSHLAGFYGSFGFEQTSAEYLEDNIPHLDMVRPAAS